MGDRILAELRAHRNSTTDAAHDEIVRLRKVVEDFILYSKRLGEGDRKW